MGDMTGNGIYSPISGGTSFRILKVVGTESSRSPIECTLLEGSLVDDELHYEAISYCWANQKPTQLIHCGGKEAYITRNCEAALRRFRPTRENEFRLLWIDSLCINQQDIQERNHQVALMGLVYARAEQVLIWLGNETESMNSSDVQYRANAFDWIVRLTTAAEEQELEGGTERLVRVVEELKSLDLLDFVDSIPWFKRSWVIQEVALSKKAILFFGQATTPLDKLIRADAAIHELQVSGIFGAEDAVSNPLWNALAVHRMAKGVIESFDHQIPSDATINNFLGEMRFSQATEAKDKVFALRGLLEESGVPTPLPDYSKSAADIYRETAAAVIQSTKGLRILEQVDGIRVVPGLTSWVPDWSSSKHSIGLLGHYYASLPTVAPFFEFRNDSKTLVVKGGTIDVVAAHCDLSFAHKNENVGEAKEYFSWTKNAHPTEPFWKDVLERNPQHSSTIIPFWNLRVLGAFVDFALGNDVASATEESVLALYYTLMSHCDSYEDAMRDQAEARQWFSILSGRQTDFGARAVDASPALTAIPVIHNTPSLAEIAKTLEYAVYQQVSQSNICRTFQDRIGRIRYKTVFRTASGKLGLAPYSIRVGDEVALLQGVRLPMVVRPFGSDYRLVGQAHVQGVGSDAWDQTGGVLREMGLV